MNSLVLFSTLCLFVSFSHAIEFDFCVPDPSLPRGPAGYSCKNPANVTSDDFVFTGFRGSRTITNVFGFNATLAFSDDYPALNGLGISMARLDLGVGGVLPLHSHRSSEVIVIISGTMIAGFIDSSNNAYYKTLRVGDVMVFPESMLHFQVNAGTTPAMAYVSLQSANPGIQFTTPSLFAGNLPAKLAEQVTLLSSNEVLRMKKLFGTA